jgi:hypothetical protein
MKFFRSKRGGIAWLACFALACQLFAAFGHIHLGNAGGNAIAFALADSSNNGSAANSSSLPQKKPASPAEFCAICAVINLAGTSVVSASSAILTPISFIQELPWSLVATEPAAFDHLPFSARGPPQA